MAIKLEIWNSPDLAKKELNKRLHHAKKEREKYEDQWQLNKKRVFPDRENNFTNMGQDDDHIDIVDMNYTFKVCLEYTN
jgi:hypothetical protein